MNFLNVAIQPRWDSPQDLFGLYDYLERTVQANRVNPSSNSNGYNRRNGRTWLESPQDHTNYQLQDQVLLVLLDEMNLARVEYYFSELLAD